MIFKVVGVDNLPRSTPIQYHSDDNRLELDWRTVKWCPTFIRGSQEINWTLLPPINHSSFGRCFYLAFGTHYSPQKLFSFSTLRVKIRLCSLLDSTWRHQMFVPWFVIVCLLERVHHKSTWIHGKQVTYSWFYLTGSWVYYWLKIKLDREAFCRSLFDMQSGW